MDTSNFTYTFDNRTGFQIVSSGLPTMTNIALIDHLYVEVNSIMEAWKWKSHHSNKIWEHLTTTKLKSPSWTTIENFVLKQMDDWMDDDSSIICELSNKANW